MLSLIYISLATVVNIIRDSIIRSMLYAPGEISEEHNDEQNCYNQPEDRMCIAPAC